MNTKVEERLKTLEDKISVLEKQNLIYEDVIFNAPIGIEVYDGENNSLISNSESLSKNIKDNTKFFSKNYSVNYSFPSEQKSILNQQINLLQKKLDLFSQQTLYGYFVMMIDEPIEWNDSVDKEKLIDYVFAHTFVTEANEAILLQYGLTRDAFIGYTANDFFSHDIAYGKQVWIDFFDKGFFKVDTDERRADGTQIYIKGEYLCIYDKLGRITGLLGIQRDITEEQLIQNKIIKSEQRFYLAMNATNDGIWDWDLLSNEIYYSPNWKKMLGYDENELPNEFSVWERLIKPEHLQKTWTILNEHISGIEGSFEIDFQMKHKDGHWVDILSRATTYFNDKGQAIRMVGTHLDVSEMKRNQKELEDSKLRWEFAIEGNNDGLWDWDIASNQLYLSGQWKKMLGYETEEIPNKIGEWHKRVHPEDIDKALKDLNYYLDGRSEFYENEHRLLCKDGSYKWILGRGKIVSFDKEGKPERIIGTHRDIHQRKRFEIALADSEKLFRTLIQTSSEGYFLLDERSLIAQTNESLCKLLNYSAIEVIGRSPYEFLDDDNKLILKDFKERINTHGSLSFEISILSKDNVNIPVILNASLLHTHNYKNSIFAFITDVSALKSAELETLRSKELLIHNEDLHNVGAWEYDVSTGEMYLTQGMYKILEITDNNDVDILEAIIKCFNIEDREKVWNAFLNCAENGEKYDFILPFTTYKNNVRWVRSIAHPILSNEKIIKVINSISDITEHVNIQDELRALNVTKDKLFTIISHDLRSPFSAILGFSDLAIAKIKAQNFESIGKYCSYIQKSAKQSYDLLNNLLQWSRVQTGSIQFKLSLVEIEYLINSTVTLLAANSKSKEITINQIIEPGLTISADELMLETVIRNLLSNALKYTSEKGLITITAYQIDDFIKISVKDNGIGIAQNDLSKLFDIKNNFTTTGTKNESGTGLGLLICKEFVEMHKGEIWVETELGKGADFIFTLSTKL